MSKVPKVQQVLGPLTVSVRDWIVQPSDGAAFFRVQVSGIGDKLTVMRRYREFASFARELRKTMPVESFPTMPPRSVVRKCFVADFMEQRRQGLGAFLEAVVAADPFCQLPALRAFLGLPECGIAFQPNFGSSRSTMSGRHSSFGGSDLGLHSINEASESDEASFAVQPDATEESWDRSCLATVYGRFHACLPR
jgi:hypothetical protein